MKFTYPVSEYAKNVNIYNELEKLEFNENDSKDFVISKLEERVKEKKKINSVLNTMIFEYIDRFEKDFSLLNDDIIKDLEEFIESLEPNGIVQSFDKATEYRLSKLVARYYKENNNLNKYLRYLFNCLVFDIVLHSFHVSGRANPSPHTAECFEIMKSYNEFTGVYKSTALRALSMTVILEPHFEYDNFWKVEDMIQKIYDADPTSKDDEMIFNMHNNIACEICDDFLQAKPTGKVIDINDIRPRIEEVLNNLVKHYEEKNTYSVDVDGVKFAIVRLQFHLGIITLDELLNEFDLLQNNVDESNPLSQVATLAQASFYYLTYLGFYSTLTEKEIQAVSKKRVSEVLPKILSISKMVNDITFNYYVLTFLNGAALTNNFDTFAQIILDITIYADKPLFIHTEMVKEISLVIFDYLVKHNPEFFDGVIDKNSDYFLYHQDEMRKLLSDCAMFHDVGKFFMLDIVENSMRKLTDIEFDIIKSHPQGFEQIYPFEKTNDEKLICIRDCALLHHVWHNGVNGYPKIANTKNRAFADIIAIADSLDAATDIYGRPYREGKTIDMLIKEFKNSEDKQYSKEVIKVFEDEKVKNNLENIVTEKRKEIYYQIYTKNKLDL